MQTEVIPITHPTALQHAVDVLHNGGIVAFPTDTVYGLAAWPFHRESIERLYRIKKRHQNKAIAILLPDIRSLSIVATHPPPAARLLADTFWPGPLTLVVPRHPQLPDILAPDGSIGVRIPSHPGAHSLLKMAGPLAVTSANLSGAANTTTAEQVLEQLQGRFHLLIDGGKTPGSVPSTVVDCTGKGIKILREGPISAQAIQETLEKYHLA
ncbi:MAG: hypothetical protein Fur0018_00270 [Anaerolineales bacterium]